MTKILLPRFPESKKHEYKDIVRCYLRVYSDEYISGRDIEIEYYDAWHFVKVSIYKWCDSGVGCGTSASRERTWVAQNEAMREVFHVVSEDTSWRWANAVSAYNGVDLDLERENYIPGIAFFLKLSEV